MLETPFDAQILDQFFKGHVLMRKGIEGHGFDGADEVFEGLFGDRSGPQGQGIGEEPDEGVPVLLLPSGDRRADHDIGLLRIAEDQDFEGGEQHHERRDAEPLAQVAHGGRQVRGTDLMRHVCAQAAREGIPIGLYGGRPEVLERLVSEVHESSSVSMLDGDDIVYVARVPTSRIMRVSINVGTRFPAYATSMGRVMLAGLEPEELDALLERAELRRLSSHTITDEKRLRAELARVRRQGWAIVDQELEEGLRSVAAPIRATVAPGRAPNHSYRWIEASTVGIRGSLEITSPLAATPICNARG